MVTSRYVVPSFFIIGAPKSGTTALANYLSDHPSLFLPKNECNYFCFDVYNPPRYSSLDEYLGLFTCEKPYVTVAGEKSVWYLYSTEAVSHIHTFNPEAKYIVMLRNPTDMVYSLHSQLLVTRAETESSFERAWGLQTTRQQGKEIPPHNKGAKRLFYGSVGLYGEQLSRVYNTVRRKQVLILFFEDFATNTHNVYEETLRFLGIESDEREYFPTINPNERLRSPLLSDVIHTLRHLRSALGIRIPPGISPVLKRLNTYPVARKPMHPHTRNNLIDYFKDDIRLLQDITGRNLSQWLKKY